MAAAAALTVLCGLACADDRPDRFVWKAAERRVDADIHAWPLPRLLDAIGAATGWQVFVEPGVEHDVTARFDGLSPVDALLRLLGDVNFALLPARGGPTWLLVYRRSAEAATVRAGRAGPPAGKRGPVPDELVVRLKRGADGDALSSRLHGVVVDRIDRAGAYRIRFEDEAAAKRARAALAHEDDVEAVETNVAIAPPAEIEPLPLAPPAGASPAPDVSPSTDRIIVGLVDMPVQPDAPGLREFLQPGVALAGDVQPGDVITHGTAMAETILDGVGDALRDEGTGSVAVPLSIIPIDVYGNRETTTTFDVARGIDAALERHVNVINLSLSSDTDSPLVRSLVQDAASHGVLVFGAAGNEPGVAPTYPAAYPATIAVTASDGDGGIAPWANRGSFVDAIAPGTNVLYFNDRAFLGTGTSVSTGWVSGWAAGQMATAARGSASAARTLTLQRWGIAGKR